MLAIRDRLNIFMRERNVTRGQLANALSTSVKTMDGWRYAGHTPPSAVLTILDLIETDPAVRKRLGLTHRQERPRGVPFQRGNKWRLKRGYDPRRVKY